MVNKILKLSLKSIFNNKMRSFLTMLGIIIGVMAVVILVSITEGATTGITDSISDMGSQLISANITDSDVELYEEDLEELSSYRGISSIAPIIQLSKTVKKNSNRGNYTILGVTPSYFSVMEIDIQRGRVILDSDIEWNTKVCVIGTDVAYDLFDTWDAVDGTITIGDNIYKVVGVLEEQGSSMMGSDDSKILIPFSTAEKLSGSSSISTFYVKATNDDMVSYAISSTESFLLGITLDEDSYEVSNESDVLDTMEDVENTMSILLGGISAISLLVGGIGIMNIMLVSVSERTKEIGIRKAVGAKRRHIMFQFLSESCILSLLGGIIGLGLSFVGIEVYNIFSTTSATMNINVGFLSLLFCLLIGVAFGSYPARKASKLQPIDALHTS